MLTEEQRATLRPLLKAKHEADQNLRLLASRNVAGLDAIEHGLLDIEYGIAKVAFARAADALQDAINKLHREAA